MSLCIGTMRRIEMRLLLVIGGYGSYLQSGLSGDEAS